MMKCWSLREKKKDETIPRSNSSPVVGELLCKLADMSINWLAESRTRLLEFCTVGCLQRLRSMSCFSRVSVPFCFCALRCCCCCWCCRSIGGQKYRSATDCKSIELPALECEAKERSFWKLWLAILYEVGISFEIISFDYCLFLFDESYFV